MKQTPLKAAVNHKQSPRNPNQPVLETGGAKTLTLEEGTLFSPILDFYYNLLANLITCVFSLYIWCAAADPADPGVFRSKKYLKILANEKHTRTKDSKLCGESTSSMQDANAVTVGGKPLDKDVLGKYATSKMCTSDSGKKNAPETSSCILLACSPLRVLKSAISLVRVRNLLCNK
ncbi:hypothetical protein CerSpe_270200 [Prunus speciosa]